jgi:hypothetical protein
MDTADNPSLKLGHGLFAKTDILQGTIIDLNIDNTKGTGRRTPGNPFFLSYFMQHTPLSNDRYQTFVTAVKDMESLNQRLSVPDSDFSALIETTKRLYDDPPELRAAIQNGLPVATANTDTLEIFVYANREKTESICIVATIVTRDIKAGEQLGRIYSDDCKIRSEGTVQYFSQQTSAVIPRTLINQFAKSSPKNPEKQNKSLFFSPSSAISTPENELALRQAAADGLIDEVARLLGAATNIDAKGPKTGKTSLIQAVLKGHVPVVALLLRKGARIDLVDNNLKTAVDYMKASQISGMQEVFAEHIQASVSKATP